MRAHIRLMLVLALTAVAAVPGSGAQATPASAEDASCARYDFEVLLAPVETTGHHLAGWLCGASPYDGQTVILASPSGLSTHAYWDWPEQKETYSFVRRFTQAGYAVFNYDRIGTGESERPAAALVSLESEAFVQNQLIRGLRLGAFGGIDFGKVVLAGNSLSTLINIYEAERFHDADGLIDTGIVVGPSPAGLVTLFASFYPAQLDPKFANDPSIPLGYATTQPGSRTSFFYAPASDPATIALDEDLKDTATVGEAVTFGAWYPFTRTVDVPVLSVVGDHDVLACMTICEPGGIEEQKEPLFWSPETCFEFRLLTDTGHFVQLQPNSAAAFGSIAEDWLSRRIGVDAESPATSPCAA